MWCQPTKPRKRCENMKNVFLKLAEDGVHMAECAGAEAAEVFISNSTSMEIDVHNTEVETSKSAVEKGLGVRVFKGLKSGFAYTTELSTSGIDEVVKQAVANADLAAEDEYHTLPSAVQDYPEINIYDPDLAQQSIENKIALAREVEVAARGYDPRVDIIESATYQDHIEEAAVANSMGVAAYSRGTVCGIHVHLTAREGEDHQTGFALDFSQKFANISPRRVGEEAAFRAVRMLGARPLAQGSDVPVVFDPYVMVNMLGILAPALTAEAVQKGRSLFADQVHQQVASEQISIIDDGTLLTGVHSAPFDGEGVPSGKTVLIENGVLKGFMHNTYTAAKAGVSSTGNAVRSSFKSRPEVGVTNFFLSPGCKPAEEIITELDEGFYVCDVMGMHTANPISGDFSVGATGVWINQGKLAVPIRGAAIAGNIRDLLLAVDAVGNDLRFFGGSGAPTVRVSRLAVSS